jgi:hypothetical protein
MAQDLQLMLQVIAYLPLLLLCQIDPVSLRQAMKVFLLID